MIRNLPSHSIKIFTGGSAKPNPGQAGSGAHVSRGGEKILNMAVGIGEGSNNLGEMAAPGLAMEALLKSNYKGPIERVDFMIDSQIAIGFFDGTKNIRERRMRSFWD
jgi:ribonuclease HI